MKIGVPSQTTDGETRVALIPAVVKKLIAAGATVVVESGAGAAAHHDDAAYTDAGATVAPPDAQSDAIWTDCDIIVTLHPPTDAQIKAIKEGAVLIGMLAPFANLDSITALAEQKVTAFSMEFVPRISRAQPMDVLSSQANIGGYKAVLLAADACPKLFPMMITAAGTIAPSKVFVIGAGVAGLQAIATAKRLGAVVEAYDVRPVVKEQVQSLGGRFVELPLETGDAEAAGGYAKEQTDEQKRRQSELMAKHIIGADAVITTAAIFGKAPPMLIPGEVVDRMTSGSVIIDMAADVKAGRGNCERTEPGKRITTDNGVIIDGSLNLPARLPVHASQMYANNIHAFLREIINKEGQLAINLDDEVQHGALITHAGQVVDERVAQALQAVNRT